jgi:hypothetical protein
VPDDISLVGFDDLPGSSYTTPPLTTIRQPLYDIGRIATQALLRIINGEPACGEVPPLELIVRETTRAYVRFHTERGLFLRSPPIRFTMVGVSTFLTPTTKEQQWNILCHHCHTPSTLWRRHLARNAGIPLR